MDRVPHHHHPTHHSEDFPDCGNNFENRITVFIQYSKILPNDVYTSARDGVVRRRSSSSTESADDLPRLFSSEDFTQLLKGLQDIETVKLQWSLVLRVESVDFIGHSDCDACHGDIRPVIVLQSIRIDKKTKVCPIDVGLGCKVYEKLQSHWKDCYIYNMLEEDTAIYGHHELQRQS